MQNSKFILSEDIRMRYINYVTLLFLIVCCSNVKSQDLENNFIGKWEVTDYKFSAIGSELTFEEARERLDVIVEITDDSVAIFGQTCFNPIFLSQKVNINEYLYLSYRTNISSSDLGITKDSVFVTSIECGDSQNLSDYFLYGLIYLDENSYILEAEEFFYITRL